MCNVSEKINELNLDEFISISGEDNEVFPYLWSLAEEKNCIYADGSIDTGALSIRMSEKRSAAQEPLYKLTTENRFSSGIFAEMRKSDT